MLVYGETASFLREGGGAGAGAENYILQSNVVIYVKNFVVVIIYNM